MAKRYIETGYYKSPFVRALKGQLKSFYNFIICDCDAAGIWVKDLAIASTYIGFEISEKEFDLFVKNGKAIDLKNGKFFFPDFIEHQYPNGLSDSNPANKKAIAELKKYKLIDKDLKTLQRPSGVPCKGTLVEVVVMVEEEVKVEVVEEVTVKPKVSELTLPYNSPEFLQAWNVLRETKKWKKKENSALQASLKKLSKVCETDAILMIENCIAGGWMGLVELNNNQKNGFTSTQNDRISKQSNVHELAKATKDYLGELENRNHAGGNPK